MRSPLPAVLACHFLAAFTVLGVPLYLPRLLADFHVPASSPLTGVLFSLPAVMTALTAGLWGRFADRYGRRLSLRRALFGLALAFALAGAAPSLPWLAAALALQGLAGGTLAAANGYLSASLAPGALAKALNWTQFSARLALLSAPPLIGAALTLFPDLSQRLWLWLAILPLGGLLMTLGLPVDVTASQKVSAQADAPARGPLRRLWMMQFLFNFAMVVTFPYFLPYAARWLHQTLAIGALYSWPHLVYLLLLPLCHRAVRGPGGFAAGMLLIALSALWQALPGGPWALLAARTLFGVGVLLAYDGSNRLLSEAIDRRRAGRQFGQIDAAGKWAGVAAGLCAGWLVAHGSLTAPFLASMVAALAAALIYCFSPLKGSPHVSITRRS